MVTGCLCWPPTCRIWILESGIFIFHGWEYSAMHIPIWYDVWGAVENQFMMLLCLSKYVIYSLCCLVLDEKWFYFLGFVVFFTLFQRLFGIVLLCWESMPILTRAVIGVGVQILNWKRCWFDFCSSLEHIRFRCSWLFIS